MSDDPSRLPPDSADFLWPTRGSKMFESGDGVGTSAVVNGGSIGRRDYALMVGFREAAELIYPMMLERPWTRDSLIYPLGMCWRQHLELSMKSLLGELQRFRGLETDIPHDHNLAKLWHRIQPLQRGAIPGELVNFQEEENVEHLLLQLHQMDKSATEFRYTTKPDGSPTLKSLVSLDVESSQRSMIMLSNFFDGASDAADTWYYEKLEFEEWKRDEMRDLGDRDGDTTGSV